MEKGIVKWFDPKKGFGFVVNDAGEDVFIHYSAIESDGYRCLRSGQWIEYEMIRGDKGWKATGVRVDPDPDGNPAPDRRD